jgi:hypothetical protein
MVALTYPRRWCPPVSCRRRIFCRGSRKRRARKTSSKRQDLGHEAHSGQSKVGRGSCNCSEDSETPYGYCVSASCTLLYLRIQDKSIYSRKAFSYCRISQLRDSLAARANTDHSSLCLSGSVYPALAKGNANPHKSVWCFLPRLGVP